ncbi:neurotensin/neuromedin N [Myripristis murdjan]|uniref:Neurotensin/neuromedin N n=1 Tax=Myripristis murdjan TaxID=586833 RepID=A0A667ZVF1_9TELE|nr:neurotensin/neuromedin N [Myripristis murdjan]
MQAQLACVLLLCFTCGGLCTDADQEQRALEEELLNSIFTSKMKQSKQSAPYWQASLANLCRMVSSLQRPWQQEAWSGEEGDDELNELYNLQQICRALQSREERLLRDSLEYLEENSDTPLKRKSPYILKRQVVHTTKSRRPYILKRSTLY